MIDEEYIKTFEPKPDSDDECMAYALELAKEAIIEDEVPVGAIITYKGRIIAKAHNKRESNKCATHHAEILAIEEACRVLGGWRLPKTTMYVTMEPCVMCAGAILNARVERVVYGAPDLRFGAFGSLVNVNDISFNHRVDLKGGVCKEECSEILSDYFKKKRRKSDTVLN